MLQTGSASELEEIASNLPRPQLVSWLNDNWSNLPSYEKDIFRRAFIAADRFDVANEFLSLLEVGTDPELEIEVFTNEILSSNNGWKLLTRVIPPRAQRLLNSNAGGSAMYLFRAAAKSSDLAHFIYLEVLLEPITQKRKSEITEVLLRSNNVDLLAYYYNKHPIEVGPIITPYYIIQNVSEAAMAKFLITHSSNFEYSNLVSKLNENVSLELIAAVLEDPRAPKDLRSRLTPYFYQSWSEFIDLPAFRRYMKILGVSVSDYIRNGNLQDLRSPVLLFLLRSKNLPPAIASSFDQVIQKTKAFKEVSKIDVISKGKYTKGEIQLLAKALVELNKSKPKFTAGFLKNVEEKLKKK